MRVKVGKTIIYLICVFLLQVNFAWSKETTTTNQKITEALNLLKSYNYQSNLDTLNYKNPTGKPVIIQFQDLSVIDYSFVNKVMALTADSEGRLYILINQELKPNITAPILALLIIHESVHCASNKPTADYVDEALATKTELEFYNKLLKDYPDLQYQQNRAIKRLNYIKPYYDNITIDKYIKENSFYASHIKD